MTFQPANSNAVYLPTTTNYPSDLQELIIRLNSTYVDIATRLNTKEIGIYNLSEFLTAQQWFTAGNPQQFRDAYRTVYSIGTIAAGATSTTAHGLTNVTAFTHIYGTCITATVDYRPIPYSSATATNAQIELKVDATNITIINGAGAPQITSALVVLEYLKN